MFPSNTGFAGAETFTTKGEFNVLSFVVRQLITTLSTLKLVEVVSCSNDGGASPIGTVTVQPLVNQIDGQGNSVPHGQLYGLPYCRIQGGANAIIIDPVAGDIGVAGFSDRDISIVKATLAQALPGSRRMMDWADGIYLFTCMGAMAPTRYVRFSAAGLALVDPDLITLTAPVIALDGEVRGSAQVFANYGGGDQVGLSSHEHPTAATGAPSPPTPGT